MSKDLPPAPQAPTRHVGAWPRRLTCAALLLAVVGFLGAAGAPETSRAAAAGTVPRRIGQLGGYGAALAVQGDLATFSTDRRLHTADLSDPAQPRLLGQSAELPDLLQDIALRDGLAVVAAGNAGLWLLDISDPAAPRPLGSLATPGVARGVAVAGNLAYVAAGHAGLLVVDIARPDRPRLLAIADTPGDAGDVLLKDGHAFVADWSGGLRVFNVADARGPVEVAEVRTEGDPERLTLQGHDLLVTQWPESLLRVDVRVPAAPKPVRFLGSGVRCAAIEAGLAFGVNLEGHFEVYDLAQSLWLTSGVVIGGLTEPIRAISAMENPAYLLALAIGSEGRTDILTTLDIRSPATPKLLGHVRLSEVTHFQAVQVVLQDRIAYALLLRPARLLVIDLMQPQTPRLLGQVALPRLENLPTMKVVGGRAFVAGGRWFGIVDLADPTAPSVMGEFEHGASNVTDLAITGGAACLAVGGTGMKVVDITDPTSPVELASLSEAGDVRSVVADGSRVFLGSERGLHGYDLSDPAHPVLVGHLPLSGINWRGLNLEGERLHVARGAGEDFELLAVDVASPAEPQIVDRVDLPVEPSHVLVSQGKAFVVGEPYESDTLWTRDLTQASDPGAWLALPVPWQTFALAASSELLVTGSFDQGLELFSTLPPPRPTLPHQLSLPWLWGGRGGDVGGG